MKAVALLGRYLHNTRLCYQAAQDHFHVISPFVGISSWSLQHPMLSFTPDCGPTALPSEVHLHGPASFEKAACAQSKKAL